MSASRCKQLAFGVVTGAAVLAALPTVSAAKAGRTAIYAGVISNQAGKAVAPIVIEAQGKKIKRIVLQSSATCSSGYRAAFHGAFPNHGKAPPKGPTSLVVGKSTLYAGPLSKAGKLSADIYGLLDLRNPSFSAFSHWTLEGTLGAKGG